MWHVVFNIELGVTFFDRVVIEVHGEKKSIGD